MNMWHSNTDVIAGSAEVKKGQQRKKKPLKNPLKTSASVNAAERSGSARVKRMRVKGGKKSQYERSKERVISLMCD